MKYSWFFSFLFRDKLIVYMENVGLSRQHGAKIPKEQLLAKDKSLSPGRGE